MKKVFCALSIVFLACMAFEGSAQPPWAKAHGKRNKHWKHHHEHYRPVVAGHPYYYYPSANVYYSPRAHRYWYPRRGAWVNVVTLPPGYVIVDQPRYEVYYNGDDVWRDNRVHIDRYRRPSVNVDIRARF